MRKQHHRTSHDLTLALLCVAGVVSCKGSTSDVKSEKSMEVMGTWATFFNETIGGVPDLLDSHFKKMPHGEALTVEFLTKNANFACMGMGWMDMDKNSAKKALDGAKKASTGKFADLPALGDAMWAAATKVDTTRSEFCNNIKAEDFKDDAAAKANELHKQLAAAGEEWRVSSAAMADALDKFENEQVLAQIEKHAKSKDYSYWFRYFNYKAKQALTRIQREPLTASAVVTALEVDHKALTEFANGKDKLNGAFESYVDVTNTYMQNAKKIRRAADEAKDDAAKTKIVEKMSDSLVSPYNSLVSMHNSLSQMEAAKALK